MTWRVGKKKGGPEGMHWSSHAHRCDLCQRVPPLGAALCSQSPKRGMTLRWAFVSICACCSYLYIAVASLGQFTDGGEGMLKKSIISLGFICAAGFAHADLKNISAGGVHSATNLEAIACTIAGYDGASYRGTKVLYIFAESMGTGRDPMLKVSSLKYNYVMQNDDWEEEYYVNGSARTPVPASLYSSFLRIPKRATDAAVIYFADPGEAVCAFTKEYANDGNLYQVQISITDVTAAITAAGIRSSANDAAVDPNGMLRADLNQLMEIQANTEK